MRRLRQVLLIEADATGDQAVCPIVQECVGRLSCGPQDYGRTEHFHREGVDVRATIIGHAQQWDETDLDATKVRRFALKDEVKPTPPSELDHYALTVIKASRIPIERPDVFAHLERALGFRP